MFKRLNKILKPITWHQLRQVKPISRVFGFDRGTPIDRYYIDDFFNKNRSLINGHVLEIADDTYSKKFGTNATKRDILHYDSTNPKATIVADLTKIDTLPSQQFDCFICTQTLNVIYDFKNAIRGGYHLLKSSGVMLATVAGLCQISKYDMDRWGDYWRFTDLSIAKTFKETFGDANVETATYGNVLSAVALLEGIAAEELTPQELNYHDKVYQVIITIKAYKK